MLGDKINQWYNGWIYLIEVICFLGSIFSFSFFHTSFPSVDKNPIILMFQIFVDQVPFSFKISNSWLMNNIELKWNLLLFTLSFSSSVKLAENWNGFTQSQRIQLTLPEASQYVCDPSSSRQVRSQNGQCSPPGPSIMDY